MSETLSVRINNVKGEWPTSLDDDKCEVDDVRYIRIASQNRGLRKLIFENNELSTGKSVDQSITSSKGLAQLIKQRNEKHAELFTAESSGATLDCTLFADESNEPPKKAPKIAHNKAHLMRKSPKAMTLEVDVGDSVHEVNVLRPVHPRDNLWVPYQADQLAIILQFIRESGFDEALQMHHHGLPANIYARKQGYVVKYIRQGAISWKRKATLEDAIAFAAVPADSVDDEEPDE